MNSFARWSSVESLFCVRMLNCMYINICGTYPFTQICFEWIVLRVLRCGAHSEIQLAKYE